MNYRPYERGNDPRPQKISHYAGDSATSPNTTFDSSSTMFSKTTATLQLGYMGGVVAASYFCKKKNLNLLIKDYF
ncbi:MAG: hypothetical protein IPL35_04240 [Sphingobacteriales bacterium]|nr:hypothetical protein [Sphingobacteriales bacterium]